jgi:hypothetical protein
VIQTLIKSWWLLALCGVLDAIFSVMIFFMASPDVSNSRNTIALLGMLARWGRGLARLQPAF